MLTLIAAFCLNALPFAAPVGVPINTVTQAVRAIDWRNIALEGDVRLRDGRWTLELEPGVVETVALESVMYADLNADGADEAVVLTTYYSGQAEPLSRLSIFTARDGAPALLDALEADALILSFEFDGFEIPYTTRNGLATRRAVWRPVIAPPLGVARIQPTR